MQLSKARCEIFLALQIYGRRAPSLKEKGRWKGRGAYKKERIKTLERFSGGALEVAVTASSSSKRSPRRVIGR